MQYDWDTKSDSGITFWRRKPVQIQSFRRNKQPDQILLWSGAVYQQESLEIKVSLLYLGPTRHLARRALTLAAWGVQDEWTVLGFTPLALFLRHRAKRLFLLPLSPLGSEPLHLNTREPTLTVSWSISDGWFKTQTCNCSYLDDVRSAAHVFALSSPSPGLDLGDEACDSLRSQTALFQF